MDKFAQYTPENPLKVTVVRSEWGRGDPANSKLLHPLSGLMCCMGFACLAAGYSKLNILGKAIVRDVFSEGGDPKPKFSNLYRYNDAVQLTESEREQKLTTEGRRVGIEFTFVDRREDIKDAG